ncbi:lytic transglycosylase domain-containing protein [Aristophania vespae]|uniref:lytic transglycosylase domain-containing protein n=1 Tax=Aristophania vespae TaxID=2697033 RepID=UPI002351675C|nr:lytic transglycosylase domain-containing protein [Aristophania vespae]UMM63673.1 Membrane-bound lytic murein transglycosylase C [Aristophania vespae]
MSLWPHLDFLELAPYVARVMYKRLPIVFASTARAIFVSAALLASTSPFYAQAKADVTLSEAIKLSGEAAFSEFHSHIKDGAIIFPHPLSDISAKRYESLFHSVRDARFTHIQEELNSISDKALRPDILAEYYLHTDIKPKQSDLRQWLDLYPQLPDANLIYTKLEAFRPTRKISPLPSLPYLKMEGTDITSQTGNEDLFSLQRKSHFDRVIHDHLNKGLPGARQALKLIRRTRGLKADYLAQLYGEVALTFLSQGKLRDAIHLGNIGFNKGSRQVGLPAFVMGLALWHEGQLQAASFCFKGAANAPKTEVDLQAASAFWEARVQERLHAKRAHKIWLRRAASFKNSFYGLLAKEALQRKLKQKDASATLSAADEVSLQHQILTESDVEAIMNSAEGRHFFALLQVGEQGRAENLARYMWPRLLKSDPVRAHSLQLVVREAGMTRLSQQMINVVDHIKQPQIAEIELPPLPKLKPHHGFKLDPALIYAVALMESNFNPDAVSPMGAYGLMQVQPRTASFVTAHHINFDKKGVAIIKVPRNMTKKLQDPGYNLEVGQLYLLYLSEAVSQASSDEKLKKGNLLHVLASYNVGPGAMLRWQALQPNQPDPLYFIETLPNFETRRYVHNVLCTTWLYAKKMGLKTPSLMALSERRWPSIASERAISSSHG